MTKYIIKTIMPTNVYFEAEARSKKEAIKKVLSGKGTEFGWDRCDHPDDEEDILAVWIEKDD